MKSLKEVKSIRQIRLDHMLEITPQPDNTCPLINSLLYMNGHRSPVYKIQIDYDPSSLSVDDSYLEKSIDQLEQWANDVLDIFDVIDKTIIDQDDLTEIQTLIMQVKEYIDNNKFSEITELTNQINDVVDDWQSIHEQYLVADDRLLTAENDFSVAVSNQDNDNENYSEIIKEAELDVAISKQTLLQLNSDFDADVVDHFEHLISKYSDVLEFTRSNNENLRHKTIELRELVSHYVGNEINLVQPMDYLKKIESGYSSEISLGLIDNNYFIHSFARVLNYLKEHDVITEVQRILLLKENTTQPLIETLKSIGYTNIRYYDDAINSIHHPKLFKEINYINQITNKNEKIKMAL